METLQKPIETSSLRTGKEKFYLTLFCVISAVAWLWFLFSVFRQLIAAFDSSSINTACYVRDRFNKTVSKTNPNFLIIGEKCLRWEDLTKEEQEKVKAGEENIAESIGFVFTTPVVFFLIFLYTIFLHYLSIGYVRMNAVMVGPSQYPALWDSLVALTQRLNLKKQPDVFVVLGEGVLNAFAAKLVFRKIIVVTSELADALIEEKDHKQLEAVMGHELGHHLLGHTNLFLTLFLLPIEYIPFFSLPLSRAREYSADRVMKAVVEDTSVCEKAFLKLAAGKKFGNLANIEEYLKQAHTEQGFFAWVAEKISTHPHLPNRIFAIRNLNRS